MDQAKMELLQGGGSIASKLIANNMDPRILRPWVGTDGRTYITTNSNELDENGNFKPVAVPINNASATLTKDAWQHLDQAVTMAAQKRQGGVQDAESAGLIYTMPNGMAHTVLQSQNGSDMTDADISMDGIRKSDADRPESELVNLPLPIVHKDFSFTLREIMASRNGQMPLDTTGASLATTKVMQGMEKLFCGSASTYTFGGGTVYGLANFPQALTKTLTAPTASGWTKQTLYDEILDMRDQVYAKNHFGPYRVYASTDWDRYLDAKEVSGASSTYKTLRQDIEDIRNVEKVMTLDFLPAKTLVLVQMSIEVLRVVTGMEVTTVQWESDGGMKQNFKVMAIKVPQLRTDFEDQTGIVVGTYS